MFNIGNNANYGLGIFRFNRLFNGRTAYSHGGTFFGYINENIVDTTSGISIAVLTNQDSVNNNGLLNLVISSLHKVTLNMPATSVNELPDLDAIKVFPNPANNQLNIFASEHLNINGISIYDNKGKLVYENVGNNDQLTIEQLPEGLYFLNLHYQDYIIRKKFVISR